MMTCQLPETVNVYVYSGHRARRLLPKLLRLKGISLTDVRVSPIGWHALCKHVYEEGLSKVRVITTQNCSRKYEPRFDLDKPAVENPDLDDGFVARVFYVGRRVITVVLNSSYVKLAGKLEPDCIMAIPLSSALGGVW